MSLLKGKKGGLLREAETLDLDRMHKQQERDLTTSPQVDKYNKKAHYLGLRHDDTLDDLARALRRLELPDDRSMLVRALIDQAALRFKAEGATFITELAELCRQTLPGTSRNGRKTGE